MNCQQPNNYYLSLILGLLAILCYANSTIAVPSYVLEKIYVPGRETLPTHARDINDSGSVLVTPYFGGSGFKTYIWKDGEADYVFSGSGRAINNNNQVIGSRGTSSSSGGWFWNGTSIVGLEEIPGGQDWSRPHALNDQGDIYGYSQAEFDPNGNWQRAVGWKSTGELFELGIDSPGSGGSIARAANNQGEVAGYIVDRTTDPDSDRAWVWKDGQHIILPLAPNAVMPRSRAHEINDSGHIVGHYFDEVNDEVSGGAALWKDGGLTLLPPPVGRDFSTANDINDRGFIVGHSSPKSTSDFAATLWTPTGRAFALEDLVSDSGGWTFREAVAINNRNQIVGIAKDQQGASRAFLLSPVIPEPSSLLLALAALLITFPVRPQSNKQ